MFVIISSATCNEQRRTSPVCNSLSWYFIMNAYIGPTGIFSRTLYSTLKPCTPKLLLNLSVYSFNYSSHIAQKSSIFCSVIIIENKIVLTLKNISILCPKISVKFYNNIIVEFNVGPPYWMRDWPVYGRNPANGKSGKEKATNLSS